MLIKLTQRRRLKILRSIGTVAVPEITKLPLRDAKLCTECDTITDSKRRSCPGCTNTAMIDLWPVVHREADRKPNSFYRPVQIASCLLAEKV